MSTIKMTKPKLGFKEIVVQGVENLLDAGCCLNSVPLAPTVSHSVQQIRASQQKNWKRYQTRMSALRERRQIRTVDAYLHRALHIYAQQYSEQGIILYGRKAQPVKQKVLRNSSAKLITTLPPPKRRNRAK